MLHEAVEKLEKNEETLQRIRRRLTQVEQERRGPLTDIMAPGATAAPKARARAEALAPRAAPSPRAVDDPVLETHMEEGRVRRELARLRAEQSQPMGSSSSRVDLRTRHGVHQRDHGVHQRDRSRSLSIGRRPRPRHG